MIYLKEQHGYPPLFKAVGCVVWCRGRLLLLKRTQDKSHPGCWGIPTGKIESNETDLRATVRELFEETGILVSHNKIRFARFYHVITEETSFFYSIYISRFLSVPNVRIERNEHSESTWVTPQEALQLMLVPDLDACLKDLLPLLDVKPIQLGFLPFEKSYQNNPIVLEQSIESVATPLDNTGVKTDKRWYTALGPPAVGKTTTLRKMQTVIPNAEYIADNSILKQSTTLNYFLRKAFEQHDHSYFLKFQISVLPVRFLQTMNAPSQSLIDETIYCTLAYSRALYRLGWIDRYDYEAFYQHYLVYRSFLPSPTMIFDLNCNTDTLMRRIRKRGRIIERNYTVEYIETLSFAFSEVASELSQEYEVVSIDTGILKADEIVRNYAPSTHGQPS